MPPSQLEVKIKDEKEKNREGKVKINLPGDDWVADDSTPSSLASLTQAGSSRGSRSCRTVLVLLSRLSAGGGSASLRLSDGNLADTAHGERRDVMYLASCKSK